MARDVADDNYYVTTGGKIPIKWTAPEVVKLIYIIAIATIMYIYRQYFIRNIQLKVMCGALDVYCMKYGVWVTNHFKTVVEKRYN